MFTFLGAFIGAIAISGFARIGGRGAMILLSAFTAAASGAFWGFASITPDFALLFVEAVAAGWTSEGIRLAVLTGGTAFTAFIVAAPFVMLTPERAA